MKDFKAFKMRWGFSMMEVMIVIGLIVMSLGFGALFSQTSQVRANVNNEASALVAYLRLAQSDAVAGKGDQSHGIHLELNAYTIFEGESYNASDSNNFIIALPETITLENIVLAGGGVDVIFNPPQGRTTTYGSFDVVAHQINQSISINIQSLGIISY